MPWVTLALIIFTSSYTLLNSELDNKMISNYFGEKDRLSYAKEAKKFLEKKCSNYNTQENCKTLTQTPAIFFMPENNLTKLKFINSKTANLLSESNLLKESKKLYFKKKEAQKSRRH